MGLSPNSRKLLDAYREHESIPSDKTEHLLQDLTVRLARGDLPSIDIEPHAVKIPATQVVWSKLPTLLPFVFGMGAMFAWHLLDRPADEPRRAQVSSVSDGSPLTEGPESVEPALVPTRGAHESRVTTPIAQETREAEELPADIEVAPNIRTRPVTRRRVQSDLPERAVSGLARQEPAATAPGLTTPQEDTLDGIEAEMHIMKRAHQHLQNGRPLEALGVLREHSRRFPRGKLADSRALTRILALCQAGQGDVARAEAAEFPGQFPHSSLAARVRAACPLP